MGNISEFETERYFDYKHTRKNKNKEYVTAILYDDHILEIEKGIYSGRHYIREDEDEIVHGYKVYAIDLENEKIKTYRYEERI